jgi:hypothetical protein
MAGTGTKVQSRLLLHLLYDFEGKRQVSLSSKNPFYKMIVNPTKLTDKRLKR